MQATSTHEINLTTSRKLFDRARALIPGGVNSPVRAFGNVGGTPPFIMRANGARVTDVDNNTYIDYVGSWGPMILGHNHVAVREAVATALNRGASFGAPTAAEIRLAELIIDMVPTVELVRLVNSGTEATMSALRLARAATARDKVVKFRGGYHGHADAFLVAAGSGAATFGVPSSPGVPAATAADTLVADYNDLAEVEALFGLHDDIAAVIVEPVAGNMGCIPPVDGFLEGLRKLCTDRGALLIFDEVMTGFRLAPGGAQQRFGVNPDLTTMGKILGGGLPIGAYGGREDLIRQIAPDGPVYQAGTLSGNPLATAAGIATLEELKAHPEIYQHLEALGSHFDAAIAKIKSGTSLPLCWNRVGSMSTLFLSAGPVTNWASASAGSAEQHTRFFHAMLAQGIYLAPSPYEAAFLSAAHTVEDIEKTAEAITQALSQVEGVDT